MAHFDRATLLYPDNICIKIFIYFLGKNQEIPNQKREEQREVHQQKAVVVILVAQKEPRKDIRKLRRVKKRKGRYLFKYGKTSKDERTFVTIQTNNIQKKLTGCEHDFAHLFECQNVFACM